MERDQFELKRRSDCVRRRQQSGNRRMWRASMTEDAEPHFSPLSVVQAASRAPP